MPIYEAITQPNGGQHFAAAAAQAGLEPSGAFRLDLNDPLLTEGCWINTHGQVAEHLATFIGRENANLLNLQEPSELLEMRAEELAGAFRIDPQNAAEFQDALRQALG